MHEPDQRREPYVGPRPFERGDRSVYFGREGEINQLLSLVVSYPVVLLYSASGTGKTSLINAGLLPRLDKQGFEVFAPARLRLSHDEATVGAVGNIFAFSIINNWVDATTRQQSGAQITMQAPNQALAGVASSAAGPASSSRDASAYAQTMPSARLAQVTLAEYLAERKHLVDEDDFARPRVLVFDQFEELFSTYGEHWSQREPFFEQVREALKDSLLRLVISMREEFVPQLDRFSTILPGGLRTRFRLEALDRTEALAAVSRPLEQTKRFFAPGVAELLVDDLMLYRVETAEGKINTVPGEFVDPVQLQVVCRSLWLNLPPDVDEITERHLKTFGSVDQALSRFYDDTVKSAANTTGIDEASIRTWFENAFITTVGTRNTVYETPLETAGMKNAVIHEFDDRHLIRAERRAAARWWELTHDRLIDPVRKSNQEFNLRMSGQQQEGSESAIKANKALALSAEALWSGRYPDAMYHATEALNTFRKLGDHLGEAAALMQQGEVRLGSGSPDTALGFVEQALVIYEQLGDKQGEAFANMKLGEIHGRRGVVEGAHECYERALALYTELQDKRGQADSLWGLALANQEHGDHQRALELFDAATSRFREVGDQVRVADALIQSGFIEYESGEFVAAETRFVEARKSYRIVLGRDHPSTLSAQTYLALAQWARGNLDSAAGLMEVVVRGQSESLGVESVETLNSMMYLAGIRQAQGDRHRALDLLLQALGGFLRLGEPEPIAAVHQRLSTLYQELGDFDSALEHGQEAVRIAPADWQGYHACGVVYWYKGQYQEAIREFTKALEIHPDAYETLSDRGQARAEVGQFEEAIADLDQAIQFAADDNMRSYARRGRAVAYAGLGELDRALQELDECVKATPENAWVYLSRAEIYLKLGREAEAAVDLDAAIDKQGPGLTPYLRQRATDHLMELSQGPEIS